MWANVMVIYGILMISIKTWRETVWPPLPSSFVIRRIRHPVKDLLWYSRLHSDEDISRRWFSIKTYSDRLKVWVYIGGRKHITKKNPVYQSYIDDTEYSIPIWMLQDIRYIFVIILRGTCVFVFHLMEFLL